MDFTEAQEHSQFEALIQGLINDQFGCCNDFLLPATVIGLRANLHRLSKAGKMMTSGTGNKAVAKQDTSIRGDKINWLKENSTDQFEIVYLEKIEKFIAYLNKTCFTSITSFESHYASYEKKSFYKRHIDQFKNEKGRKFSIVLYLNQAWTTEDGGMLSLFPKQGEQIDISPLGGRIVLFRSDEMEHEVNASLTRERTSIASWLKN